MKPIYESAEQLEDFCVFFASKGGMPDIPQLKRSVGDLIRLTVQKSSGDQTATSRTHLNWDNHERVRMEILSETIKLAHSDILNGLVDVTINPTTETQEEYPTWDFLFAPRKTNMDFKSSESIFNHLKPRQSEADIYALRYAVGKLEEYRTRPERSFWKNVVICEAVALVLSGVLELIGGNINDQSIAFDEQRRGKEINRLAAYEDTGLTPEEIVALIPPPNAPLTMEELREMDGQPVWFCKCHNGLCNWCVIDHTNETNIFFTDGTVRLMSSYGDGWLAYRRRPEEEIT